MMDAEGPVAPDGGWGWVIVFCSFFIHAVCHGITMALGVLYVSWLTAFNSSKSETSWIVSIAVAVMYGVGPFAAGLALKIGYRAMAIVGALMMAVGFFLSSFASSVLALIFTIGVLGGGGFGLAYLSAIAVPAFYFDKKRSMAMGLGSAGVGAGMFLLAPLMNWLVNMYGWRGTMLFLSGICLNVCVAGALMRPLDMPDNNTEQNLKVANDKENAKESDFLMASYDTITSTRSLKDPRMMVPTITVNDRDVITMAGLDDLSKIAMSTESMKPEKKKKKLGFKDLQPLESDEENEKKESEEYEKKALDEMQKKTGTDKALSTEHQENLKNKEKQASHETQPNNEDQYKTISSLDARALKEIDTNVQNTEESEKTNEVEIKHPVSKRSYYVRPVKGGPFHRYKSSTPKLTRKNSFGQGHKPHHVHKEKRYTDKYRTNINLMLDYAPSSKPPTTFIHLHDLSNEQFLSKLERKKLFNQDRVFPPLDFNALTIPKSSSDLKLAKLPSLSPSLDREVADPIIGGSMHQLATVLPSELDVEASRGFRSEMELATGPSRNLEKLIGTIRPRDVLLSGSMYNLMTLDRTLTQSRRSLHRTALDRTSGRQSLRSLIRSDLGLYRRPTAPDEPTPLQKLKEGIKANLQLMKDPTFMLFALSNFLTNLSLVMPMVFMVDRAISVGISKQSAAMLISLNGAGTICGRVTSALVADRKWMNRLLAYILTLSFAGLVTSLSPLCSDNQVLHGVYSYTFGILTGCYGALCPCVLVDLKGLESVGQSYGLLLLFMGVSTLMGTPLGGLVYDMSGNFDVPFILHGAFITVSGLILVPLLIKQSKCRQEKS